MSNYNFIVTLDGLNNVNANDINTDNIVTDYLTVVKNSSVPLVTPYTSNTNQIASCAFVQDAFLNNLLNYALLHPLTPQTFTGTNIFGTLQASTPSINTNSVRVATTAYVKNNLLNYGLLNPITPQTFTGSHNFPTQLITDNSTLCATTAYVKNNLLNYVTLNTTQTITAQKTFDVAALFNGGFQIRDQPAYTNMSQCYQVGPNLVLQNYTANGKIKFSSTNSLSVTTNNILLENGNHIVLQGIINQGIDILNDQITMNGNLTLNKPFISNYIDLSASIFENQFLGSVFGYQGFVCKNGFYVKSGPETSGVTTYALIDSTGNISTTSTISAIGLITSDTGFSIPSTSPLLTINNNGTITQTSTGLNKLFNSTFSGTSNQIEIKNTSNVGPSTISQSGSSLTISAVTNNASAGTSLVLATRTSTNGGCVLFNGNSGNKKKV